MHGAKDLDDPSADPVILIISSELHIPVFDLMKPFFSQINHRHFGMCRNKRMKVPTY